jgi:hypothetical protein
MTGPTANKRPEQGCSSACTIERDQVNTRGGSRDRALGERQWNCRWLSNRWQAMAIALGGRPLGLSAEGATREEAVANLRERIRERLSSGVEILALELPSKTHPLARFAGIFDANDPLVQDWLQIMAKDREPDDDVRDAP